MSAYDIVDLYIESKQIIEKYLAYIRCKYDIFFIYLFIFMSKHGLTRRNEGIETMGLKRSALQGAGIAPLVMLFAFGLNVWAWYYTRNICIGVQRVDDPALSDFVGWSNGEWLCKFS